jgi:REP element-mobilizing transposase RayT
MLTRTIANRRFLLRPSEVVNEVIRYCLFAAAEKCEVLIHSITVMSNHVHVIVTADAEQLSDFNAWLNGNVANCLLEHYRAQYPELTLETLWSSDKPHEDVLATKSAILDALVYMCTNPVEAKLVHDYRDWPGLCSRPRDMLADGNVYARPKLHFAEGGRAPETVFGRFTLPPAFADEEPEDVVRTFEHLVAERQQQLRNENAGKPYLGVKAILRTDPLDSPKNPRPRKRITPTVSAGGDAKVMREAKKAVHAFRRAYRAVWNLFKELGEACFPAGTLMMHHRHFQEREKENGFFDWCVRMRAPA